MAVAELRAAGTAAKTIAHLYPAPDVREHMRAAQRLLRAPEFSEDFERVIANSSFDLDGLSAFLPEFCLEEAALSEWNFTIEDPLSADYLPAAETPSVRLRGIILITHALACDVSDEELWEPFTALETIIAFCKVMLEELKLCHRELEQLLISTAS